MSAHYSDDVDVGEIPESATDEQLHQVPLPTVDDLRQSSTASKFAALEKQFIAPLWQQAFIFKEPSVQKKFKIDEVSEYQYRIVQQADNALRNRGKV